MQVFLLHCSLKKMIRLDVSFLWVLCMASSCFYIVQIFCNAIMGKRKGALDCLKKYLMNDAIQNKPMFSNWRAYIINMAMPN